MRIGDLEKSEFRSYLQTSGIYLETGPFLLKIQSAIDHYSESLYELYTDFSLLFDAPFSDFHIRIEPWGTLRRWLLRPQVQYVIDDSTPFRSLPDRLALPFFEWGLNWTIATYANQFLIIHSAVLEKDGRALILPGPPASGKSTLCAALAVRGWRLFSDELTLIRTEDGGIIPIPRPISLKNDSIEEIAKFSPEVKLGPLFKDTHKGTIAHMRPPDGAVFRSGDTASAAWVVFPCYRAGESSELQSVSKARAFVRVADNSYNYSLLGSKGFEVLTAVVDGVDAYDLTYSDLGDAVSRLSEALLD